MSGFFFCCCWMLAERWFGVRWGEESRVVYTSAELMVLVLFFERGWWFVIL